MRIMRTQGYRRLFEFDRADGVEVVAAVVDREDAEGAVEGE
jgi:hypothetical protein